MYQYVEWTELDREYPPAGEEADIEATILMMEAIMKLGPRPILRNQHAKSTGDVQARLIVDPDRPAETRHGIFETERTFEAIVRFSNGSGAMNPDTRKDARGMAIKVLGVEGPRAFEEAGDTGTQDFVMINFPQFPVANARQYRQMTAFRRFFAGLIGPPGINVGQILFFLSLHPVMLVKVASNLAKTSRSPLAERYWSMSPYRLGTRAIKFSLVPHPINSEGLPPADSPAANAPDQLSEALKIHLRESEARFDFVVQFQKDPKAMPIEDPTVRWDEAISKPVKVATLIIDRADLDSEAAIAFRKSVEHMSFNPWHALEAHRPLGGINRMRKAVYQASTRLRREAESR